MAIQSIRNTQEVNKTGLRVAVIADLLSRKNTENKASLVRELQGIGAVVADAMIFGNSCGNEIFLSACESLSLSVAKAYLKA